MNVAQAVAAWLVAQTVQVALVFAFLFVLDVIFARTGNARLRAIVWTAFFVKLILPPGSSSPVSVVRMLPSAASAPSHGDAHAFSLALTLIWASGVLVAACVAARRMRSARLQWSIERERPAPLDVERLFAVLAVRAGLRRVPHIVVRTDIRSGACVGLVAPRIAVSAHLLAPDRRAALEHVLLHELGHARRRDGLRSLAWTTARCVYWFHPLVHLGARRAALVREMSCDDFAARIGVDGAAGYRRTLLDTARAFATPDLVASGFSGGEIIARIERLSRTPSLGPRASRVVGVALFVVLCACCIPLGRASPRIASMPAFDDLQGCLRKRFAVMAEIERRGGLDKALESP